MLLPVIECRWNLTPGEARLWQRQLAAAVRLEALAAPPRLIAGADTSYNRGSNRVAGAVVVWDTAERRVVAQASAVVDTPFPYVPGLLAMREAPALMPAFAALAVMPDLLMFNGHGTAHPARCGLACHMGVVFDLPAVGVAQQRLCGRHEAVGQAVGDGAPVILDNDPVGVALRTRRRCNPVYASPGHRADLAAARAVTLETTYGHRLPAPLREAHRLANAVRRSFTPCKD